MRIKSVELVNHINFENLSIDNLDTADIITLSGVNGSGKSFFINVLHPWPTSSRYVKNYSIIEGKEGYKRIVFQKNSGELVEVMHEYVPKKNSHACKSYINIITDGVKQELNPTGHSEVFKEMVKKHLAFDNNVFEVSCISFKTNGITSSSSVNRKKIMETTLNLDGLKSIKKKSAEVNSGYGATMKVLENQKIKILSVHDAATMEKELKECEENVINSQKEIERISAENRDTKYKLDLYTDVTDVHKEQTYATGRLLKEYGGNSETTLGDILNEWNKIESRLPLCESAFNEASKNLDKLTEFEEIVAQLDKEEIRLSNAKSNHKEYKTKAMSVFSIDVEKYRDNEYLNNICNEFEALIKYQIRPLAELIRSCPIVYTTNSIVELLNRKQENMNRINNFIAKFDLYQSMSDGNDYTVPYGENCDRCNVYDKFVKSSQFIKDNIKKYKEVKTDISEEHAEIGRIQNIINISNNWNIGKILSQYVKDDYMKTISMDTIYSFIARCREDFEEESRIEAMISILRFMIIANEDIDDAVESLRIIKEKKELLGDITDERGVLTTKVKELGSELAQLARDERRLIDCGIKDLNEDTKTVYRNNNLTQIKELCFSYKNIDTNMRLLRNQIAENEANLSKHNSTINESNRKIAILQHSMAQLKDTSESLQLISQKKKVAQRLKEIIEKDIPIMLMKNNLDYIERSVNAILQDNQISMSIHIIPTDTEIQIEAIVNGRLIPDVSLLSAGETCIVSLLLNASILRILGYNILCLDEIDANLDTINKKKFSNLIYSIMNVLGIDQVICVSHNITQNIDSAMKLLIGDGEGLDIDKSSMIRIK